VKFAWPSLMLHSSTISSIYTGGTSATLASVLARPRWNDAIDGFVDNGGEGKAEKRDVSAFELTMDKVLFGSAIVGDCRGL
jgi:hypothetical protein